MHKAKACVLICIDFRFQKIIYEWLKKNRYLGKADIISVAGASRDLAKPIKISHKLSLIRQIEISLKLHNPQEIIIIDHQDCGGYAQDKTIEPGLKKEVDKKKHSKFAKNVKKNLESRFPGKKIKNLYITLDGKIEEL